MAIGRVGVRPNANLTNIVTNGLILNLDASKTSSYPGSGSVWYDISGNNLNASLINGPVFNSSNGGSIVFDGSNDYGQIANDSRLNASTQTISVWYKPTRFGSPYQANLIGKHDSWVSSNGYQIYDQSGAGLKQNVATGRYVYPSLSVQLNNWYLITLSFTIGSSLSAYINGGNKSTNTLFTLTITNNPIRLAISLDSFWSVFKGNIGQITIYNRVLTDAEVLQNYNATKSRFGL